MSGNRPYWDRQFSEGVHEKNSRLAAARKARAVVGGHTIPKPCPLARSHGETICKDGYLWQLTYSEMGPPGSRQNSGPCPFCRPNEEQEK